MERREQHRLPYQAPLDGIRAVAILAVLTFHAWPAALKGGFTGVDVFFVLSGFLITTIVLNDIRDGRFSIREFYLRRIQRLLPNIAATVIGSIALWLLFMPPGAPALLARHGLWTLFSLSNFYVWLYLGGYWGAAAESAPLTHTWSLGVEEQFYLFYPGFLLLLTRLSPGRIKSWLLAMTLLGFGLSLYGTQTHPAATFYLLPTRVWELLLGGVLASFLRQVPPLQSNGRTWAWEAAGWAGICVIACGFVFVDVEAGYPGLQALAPTLGTTLVILSVMSSPTRLARVLSTPFMVGTGRLSFSIYLWHWPLIILGRSLAQFHEMPKLAGSLGGAFCGVVFGWVAYTCVEQPLRRRGPGRRRRLATIAVGFSVAALCCLAVASRRVGIDPDHRLDTPAFYGELFDAGRPAKFESAAIALNTGVYFPPVPPSLNDAWRTGGVQRLYGGGPPRVVVFGSSHALMYSRLIDSICHKAGISVAFLAANWGTPAFYETTQNANFSSESEAHEFDEARREWLRKWHPDVVFAIDRWELLCGKNRDFGAQLTSFLRETCPLAGRVVFVAGTPGLNFDTSLSLRQFASWRMSSGAGLPRIEINGTESVRKSCVALAEAAVPSFPNLRVLRADLPFYEKDGSVRYAEGRTLFFIDDNHLSDAGSEEVRGQFESAIVEAMHARR